MERIELLKNIINLDLRKNNIVKLNLTEKFRGFRATSYTEEADGTFSIEITLTNLNYYWWDKQSNRSNDMGYHQATVFEGHDGRNKSDVSFRIINKIEVVKQGKSRTKNPIIEMIIKNAPLFTESENYIKELGL